MKWDKSIENGSGCVVLLIKHLLYWRGCRIDIRKLVNADGIDKFHTHPAWAIRVILWGGYTEELEDGSRRIWKPGRIGIVQPSLCHRIHNLLNEKSSWTLWLRGPCKYKMELRGDGWDQDAG